MWVIIFGYSKCYTMLAKRTDLDHLDQDRLDQDRLDQDRLDQDRLDQDRLDPVRRSFQVCRSS
jgi:hypothetical protein